MAPLDRFKLSRLRVEAPTKKRYDKVLNDFLEWLPDHNFAYASPSELDELLNEYAIHIYDTFSGRKRQTVVTVKAALEFYLPEIAGDLSLTALSLKGWAKKVPIEQMAVCPEAIAYGIAVELVRDGVPDMAIAILLIFDAYLRAGDVGKARVCDLVLPNVEGHQEPPDIDGVLMLPKTKRGLDQSVVIRRNFLITLLRRQKRRRMIADPDPLQLLFGFSLARLRKKVHLITARLGLQELDIKLHSLRYGGASQDALENRLTFPEIKARGRWKSDATLHRYLQPGHLLAQLQEVPRATRTRFAAYVANPYRVFNVPRPVAPLPQAEGGGGE